MQAALVKEMGTRFEQDLLESIRRFVDVEPVPDSSSLFERLLANAILTAPVFTIRGGTIEILRSVAAKGFGREHDRVDALLSETANRVFADAATFAAVEQAEADGWAPTIWDAVAETGLAWVSVPEAAGGSGRHVGRRHRGPAHRRCHAVPLPLCGDRHARRLAPRGRGLEVRSTER